MLWRWNVAHLAWTRIMPTEFDSDRAEAPISLLLTTISLVNLSSDSDGLNDQEHIHPASHIIATD